MLIKKKKNDKSIFALHVYESCPLHKKRAYHVFKDVIEATGSDTPSFLLFETELGFFQTLAEAEKQIKKTVKSDNEDLYGFLVEEKVVGRVSYPHDVFSSRVYLKDGSLVQHPLNKGDLVEIIREDSVNLAIVWKTPPMFEEKNAPCYCVNDPTYAIVYFEVCKDGKYIGRYEYCDASKVRPPSIPVPKKYAAELRRQLKYYEAVGDDKDDFPF